MKFNIDREKLLPALQMLSGVVDRRQTLPILSNLLFNFDGQALTLTATDMEVELIVNLEIDMQVSGEITLPARKLFDICKALPAESELQFEIKNDKALIKSGKSRFTLATLPAQEYPVIDISDPVASFSIKQSVLESLLENTQFAMAQQDVRYYLNGLLLEISKEKLRCVATDGHRLALDEAPVTSGISEETQIIVPRKGITELMRLLDQNDEEVEVVITGNHIRIKKQGYCFTSKLIDGRFPEYQRVIPELSNNAVTASRDQLKDSLTRASILSNEKYRGVRIILSANSLRALAHNPEQEEAEEEVEVDYSGDEIEIGFNVSYLLDTLSIIKSKKVRLSVLDPNSSCLILPEDESSCQYVVMPMRL